MQKPMEQRGCLCGLPVAVKDLDPVEGVRTTWGSPIYKDFVPTASDCMVDVIEANGGVVYAKTNTPEFGAGANTFNEVFGATLNPWNTTKSCAGSSGGSAVALATGMAWLATGSDLGGSLRNPASFCSVVGFRPSPGRVPHGPAAPGAYPEDLGGMPNSPFPVLRCFLMAWRITILRIPYRCRKSGVIMLMLLTLAGHRKGWLTVPILVLRP